LTEWQGRPLDACYPLVFFDAIRVKIRDEGFVRNKAVYIALGILPDGTKEILGLWIEQTEGAKFWLRVMNELRSRIPCPQSSGRSMEATAARVVRRPRPSSPSYSAIGSWSDDRKRPRRTKRPTGPLNMIDTAA
jgi:hypothetical protein